MNIQVTDISPNGNLIVVASKGNGKEYIVSYNRAKRLQEVFPDLSLIKNIDKEFRRVIGGMNSTAYWSVLNFINTKVTSNDSKLKSITKEKALPHVLIIDEINRGNVSAIIGRTYLLFSSIMSRFARLFTPLILLKDCTFRLRKITESKGAISSE